MMVPQIALAMKLAQFAPSIIGLLSGSKKAESVAEKVVETAEIVTGLSGDDAVQAMAADPSLVLKFRERLVEIEADTEKAYLQDRQHARTTHREHWMPWALTLTLAAMVGFTIAGLIFIEIPMSNREVLYLIVGQLIGAFVTAVAYWLGSSRGSATKQNEINEVLSALRK